MFKPHIGSCNNCPRTETWIVVKAGLCQYCNHERKQLSKPKATSNGSTAAYDGGGDPTNNTIHSGYGKNRMWIPRHGINKKGKINRVNNNHGGFKNNYGEDIGNATGMDAQSDQPHEHGRTPRKVFPKNESPVRKTRKPIFKPKKGTGEAEIFAEIAEEREWTCFVTKAHLMELTATQFMHVLPKALNKYPLFKLYKPNIQLATNEVHHLWDHTPRSELRKDRRFDKLFELEEELKEKYKLLK